MSDQDFDSNARKLLLRQILEGSLDKAVNYSPDFRDGQPGPLTIQIAQILRRHARLWAQSMRENPNRSLQEAQSCWRQAMREADAEVKRYVAGPTFKSGAAA